MDIKSTGEVLGFFGTLKELSEKFTGKAEIKELQQEIAEKDLQLNAANAGVDSLGLSSEHLAILGISFVAVVAIVAIAVVAVRCQPAMIRV